MKKVIAIVGPTAVGKSKLALYLAQKFNGEIINADSRQVYRYMDIGTAKPSQEEQQLVPHHLISVVNPDEHFSLAMYKDKALEAVATIQMKGKIPFLVGGTGLYIMAVIEAWKIPQVPPDRDFREKLKITAEKEGISSLYNELQLLDPITAQKIQPNNLRRIIRALEIYNKFKVLPSSLVNKGEREFNTLIIGLTMAREALYKKIDIRVDEMIRQGFVEEVEKLLNIGYKAELPSMSGIGYQQILRYLNETMTLEDALMQIKQRTRRFASRQYAWFKLEDNRIYWFDVQSDIKDNIEKLILRFLSNRYRNNDNEF